jgi:hypothetical protein
VNVRFARRMTPAEPEPEPWIDHPGDGRGRRRQKYQTREMRADEREFRDFRNARANLRNGPKSCLRSTERMRPISKSAPLQK